MKKNIVNIILFCIILFTTIACEKRPDNIRIVKYLKDSTLVATYNKMDIPYNDYKLVSTYHHDIFSLKNKQSLMEGTTYEDLNQSKFRHDKLFLKGSDRLTIFTYQFKNTLKIKRNNLEKLKKHWLINTEPLIVGDQKFNVDFELDKISLLKKTSFTYDILGKVIESHTFTNHDGKLFTVLGDFLVDINGDHIADLQIRSLNKKSTYSIALFEEKDDTHLFLIFPSTEKTNSAILSSFLELKNDLN